MAQHCHRSEKIQPRMHKLIPVAALAALAMWPGAGPAATDTLDVTATKRLLNVEDPAQREVGRLRWRGGLKLSAADRRFGGLSGMYLTDAGRALTAVTDQGSWLTARLVFDQSGDLAGIEAARIGRLSDPAGRALQGKKNQDAEALTLMEDGSVLVAFEHRHRILRYPAGENPLAGRPRAMPLPPGISALKGRNGLEALVSLGDGRVLALGQVKRRDGDGLAGFLWDGESWAGVTYRTATGFQPSGAARLPGGDLVVLERRFTPPAGLAIRLRRIPLEIVRPGAVLAGEEIALMTPPLTLDNMEAVAARRGPAGETLITLLSDDNFHFLQRTLLLMFELVE